MNREERWQQVRNYAMGKQDISKYKEQLKSSHTQSNYIKIDWSPRKLMKRIMRKLLNRASKK